MDQIDWVVNGPKEERRKKLITHTKQSRTKLTSEIKYELTLPDHYLTSELKYELTLTTCHPSQFPLMDEMVHPFSNMDVDGISWWWLITRCNPMPEFWCNTNTHPVKEKVMNKCCILFLDGCQTELWVVKLTYKNKMNEKKNEPVSVLKSLSCG